MDWWVLPSDEWLDIGLGFANANMSAWIITHRALGGAAVSDLSFGFPGASVSPANE